MYQCERRDMRLALDGASCAGSSLDLALVVKVSELDSCDVPDFKIPRRNIARATSMTGAERVEDGQLEGE